MYTYICINVYIHIYIHIYTYIYMYICIYINPKALFFFTSFLKILLKWLCLSEDIKVFFFNINYFHQFLRLFPNFLVTKKLMTSPYNRWRQHVFTFDLLQIDHLTVVECFVDIRLVLLKIWREGFKIAKLVFRRNHFDKREVLV